MSVSFSNKTFNKIYYGSNEVKKVFIGNKEIYSSAPAIIPYLIFSSPEAFTIKVYNETTNWDGVVEYSTDKQSWNTWDATEIASALSEGQHHLYMRGTGNTHICINSRDGRFIINGSNVSCIGNIENMLDYQSVLYGISPQMGGKCVPMSF